ncbi:ABC transporter ATP-binding protein [Bacillus sp. JJ1532]|uniref:ABC transporter ATP-binding protein n=1 Tax=Bacillus sp. JJ1532 TaxID=3122958 RepID=UPI002FFF1ACE
MDSQSLLEVKKLETYFYTERGIVKPVDNVSFHVNKGEIVGLVGESGCGKSVTAQSILRLLDEHNVDYEGEINIEGKNIIALSKKEMRKIRGNDISMIFQDPSSSLNPVHTIGKQIIESLRLHKKITKKDAYKEAIELLRVTGIPSPEKRVAEYPHQLSGGMKQRAMIAIALACQPKILIADEPTTALDVTIQAQILNLIRDLNKRNNMGVIFITHDLGVVAELCHRVIVMYLGQIVEEADVKTLFTSPKHPYTRGLLKSIPQMDGDRSQKLHVIEGSVPSQNEKPKGCNFAPRCPFADKLCMVEDPGLFMDSDHQKVKCWHYKEIALKEEGNYEVVYGRTGEVI